MLEIDTQTTFSNFQSERREAKGNDDDDVDDDSIIRKRVTSDARRLSSQRRLRMSSLAYPPKKLLEAVRDPRERYRLRSVFYLQNLNETDREDNDAEQPDRENNVIISHLTARERRRRKFQRQSEMKK